MKNKRSFTRLEVTIIVALLLVSVGAIAFRVWVFATYGNTPVTELPAWVWWIMQPAGGST